MGFLIRSRQRRVAGQPRAPMAIAFIMEDFAEMQEYAALLAPHGVTWRVEAMDSTRPEIAIIYRGGVPIFELWRSTTGLLLRCLDTKRDAGTIDLQDQGRAWSLVCCLTTPPIWPETKQEMPTNNPAIACLLKWLRA